MKSYDVEARKVRNAPLQQAPSLHLMGCWRVYYAIWGLTYFAAAVFHLVHLLVKYYASFTPHLAAHIFLIRWTAQSWRRQTTLGLLLPLSTTHPLASSSMSLFGAFCSCLLCLSFLSSAARLQHSQPLVVLVMLLPGLVAYLHYLTTMLHHFDYGYNPLVQVHHIQSN
jgi:hypothetical protein